MRERPQGCGQEPGRLRGQGEPQQRLGSQRELLEHDVEGAGLAAVAPEGVIDVEGRGAEALRHRRHHGGRGKVKGRGSLPREPRAWPQKKPGPRREGSGGLGG